MKILEIYGSVQVLLDDHDYYTVCNMKWHKFKSPRSYTYYTVSSIGTPGNTTGKNLYMHRVIMGINDRNIHVDHRNRNGLDNRRDNLRIATPSQNHANLKIPVTNTSGYKGVILSKRKGYFESRIKVNQKCIYLGSFSSAEEAAEAYEQASKKYFGQFSRIE